MDEILSVLIEESEKAYNADEIPVGAVIVKNNKIISRAHNIKQSSCRCIDHAEILAIINAEEKLGDWRLTNCDIYVTLEPCKMCMEVIRQARIKNVYYLLSTKFTNEDDKKIEKIEIDCDDKIKKEYKSKLSSFFISKR